MRTALLKVAVAGAGVALLPLAGCGGSGGGSPVAGLVEPFSSPSPAEVARQVNAHDADTRRRSINRLATASWGGERPYLELYRLAVDDDDPTVRAACLRALGRHGEPEDVNRIIPYLEDEHKFVRWEAAKALQRLHDAEAIDPLLERLRDDEDADVRQAAANALAQYPRLRVFQGLVGALNDDDYGVVREAVRSLRTLTGQDLGEDGAAWLAWSEEKSEEEMFEGRSPYFYPQYEAPRRWWEPLAFWRSEEPAPPKQPKGLSVAEADGGSDQPRPARFRQEDEGAAESGGE